jgi:hypothetical protein
MQPSSVMHLRVGDAMGGLRVMPTAIPVARKLGVKGEQELE